MIIEAEPRRTEPGGERVTVDIEHPPASQLEKWEPHRAAAAPSPVAASTKPSEGHVTLANSEGDESQVSGSLASSDDDDDEEAEGIVDRMTRDPAVKEKPYLAALEALGSRLTNAPEDNTVNIGNSIIKDTGTVHLGPYTVNKFLGTIQIGTVNYANPAADEDRIDKQTEAEATQPRSKLSTTSDHPLFPLSQAKVAEWLWSRKCIVSIIVTAVLLIVITVVAVVVLAKAGTNEQQPPSSQNDSSLTTDPVIPGVRIVPRPIWGAQPPRDPPDRLKEIPAPYVIISHTATDFCFTQAQCVLHVRFAQTFHMESYGWNDIGYNFLVGGDGSAYEGRGWDIEGAHTFNYNYKSIGISLIGTFDKVAPNKGQLHALRKLIEFGVETGKISKDYKLLGHRQFTKTESPGQKAYEIIQTWDHWVPTP